MLIANPIYDVVFKYLMEDTDIAKGLLSIIIGQEILEIDFQPQELVAASARAYMTVLRLDFRAIVRMPDGSQKKVLIEMQKAQKNIDVQRFRRYLGRNYMDTDRKDEGNKGLPIILIYFLGFNLTIKCPVLKINREYQDVATGETLIGASDPFIESLTHDAFIVQIGALASETQTDLEKVLSVFNQKWVFQKEPNGLSWLLKYPAHQQHPLLDKILDRLALATESEEVQQDILAEEEFFNSLDNFYRQKEEEVAQERKEKEEAQKTLAATIKVLHQSMSIAQIATMLDKPETEIAALLNK